MQIFSQRAETCSLEFLSTLTDFWKYPKYNWAIERGVDIFMLLRRLGNFLATKLGAILKY